jgi:ABC-type arginine transport system permease subunit
MHSQTYDTMDRAIGALLVLGLVWFAVILFFFIAWVWAIVDILKNEFTGYNKLIWILVLIFVPPIGVLLYLFIGKNQKITKE